MAFTIHHGDCREVMATLDAESVDAVIADPPYGIGFPYLSYEDTRENLVELISGFLPQARKVAARVFVLCGPTQIGLYPQPDWVMNVTWNTTGSFGKYGYNQWTPILCYGKDVKGFGRVNGVLKSDVLRISGGGGVGFMRSEREKKHTCPKPITLMQIVVDRLTMQGECVLDPFCGSGSTGVACVAAGRRFIGIEREVEYVKIAKARIAAVDIAAGPLFA
jgi:DNA modification methylase